MIPPDREYLEDKREDENEEEGGGTDLRSALVEAGWRLAEDKVRLGDMGQGLTEVGAEIVSALANSVPKTFQKSKFTHLNPY